MNDDYIVIIAGLLTVGLVFCGAHWFVEKERQEKNTPHYQLNHCYENTPSEFNKPIQIKIVNIGKTKYQYDYLDSLNLRKKLKLSPGIYSNLEFHALESEFTKEISCE